MVDVLLLEQQPMPAARMRIGLPEYPVGIAQGIEFGTRQAAWVKLLWRTVSTK